MQRKWTVAVLQMDGSQPRQLVLETLDFSLY